MYKGLVILEEKKIGINQQSKEGKMKFWPCIRRIHAQVLVIYNEIQTHEM